jgi:AcrR family transcriptional regulator
MSRRAEYAEATKRAILTEARRLFYERGFFATRVDDIAAAARVAPATVYAVAGGKQGLLRALMELWLSAPEIEQTLGHMDSLEHSAEVIDYLAWATRAMREDYADVMKVLLRAAPHDEDIRQGMTAATDTYRAAIERVARHMRELGDLDGEVGVGQIRDVLWFYFGYSGLFTLCDDNGWDYERAQLWLAAQAKSALLGRGAAPADGPRS